MITMQQIQENLIKEIKQCTMTQSELAKRLNIKQQTVSAYVNGRKLPSLDTFANLCAVLGLNANDILCIK